VHDGIATATSRSYHEDFRARWRTGETVHGSCGKTGGHTAGRQRERHLMLTPIERSIRGDAVHARDHFLPHPAVETTTYERTGETALDQLSEGEHAVLGASQGAELGF
jgi:hypothetical protein